jgi:two-component system, NarL family, sensor histidine kinase UhpB
VPLSIFQINFTILFFIYGLAFFTMGLALILESGRSPLLVERHALILLAVFGLLHGLHEWIEIYLLQLVFLEQPLGLVISWFRVGWLAVSFAPLLVFGLVELRSRPFSYIVVGLLSFYLIIFISGIRAVNEEMVLRADAFARYLLAFPGGVMAGLSLLRRARLAQKGNQPVLGQRLLLASGGFYIYGLTQLFVPSVDFFPANLINSQLFFEFFNFPIQVVRAVMALLIMLGLLRAIQVVEAQRQAQLFAAQQARLEALEQVQQELVAREAMRRELLRHIVIAQEDERSRIAQELHDETAQILTAITLNLATLQRTVEGEANEIIDRLQNLARNMSRGIHNLVHDLRPAQLDDLGLVHALQYLAEQENKRTGLEVQFKVEGNRQRLDKLVETVIFRVAQEALTNTSKHAEVKSAQMSLNFSQATVMLRVQDAGKGFDPQKEPVAPHGWGLAGMRERVESVGGELHIKSAPGEGTLIAVDIPVQEANSDDLKEVFHAAANSHRSGG